MYNESMKKIKYGHTVAFVEKNNVTLYGTVEKIEVGDEEFIYTIYANNHLYRNVPEHLILHNYGDFGDE